MFSRIIFITLIDNDLYFARRHLLMIQILCHLHLFVCSFHCDLFSVFEFMDYKIFFISLNLMMSNPVLSFSFLFRYFVTHENITMNEYLDCKCNYS